MRDIKTVYLVGPIEFMENPDADWRCILADMLQKELGITSIDPVKTSFLVGQTIKDNAAHAAQLKKEISLEEFKRFMDQIWRQDKENVDKSDALVTWSRSEEELKQASSSSGTMRELCRAASRDKELFLICSSNLNLGNVSSHFLHMFLSAGGIFNSPKDLIDYLRYERPFSKHLTYAALMKGWKDFRRRD